MGGWAGSSINHRISADQGERWSAAIKIFSSPFLNVSTLVRSPPIPYVDGSFGLPVYHELMTKHGEWLHITAQGKVLSKTRMPLARASLQPTVAPISEKRAIALLRDAGPGDGHIQVATTRDAGEQWLVNSALPLRNPNASIAMIKLLDGRLLLAANPGQGRHELELWIGDHEGQRWHQRKQVDGPQPEFKPDRSALRITNEHLQSILPDAASSQGSGPAVSDETSYPALLQTRDGMIHLAYTWHRKRIRLLSFNTAWLDQAPRAKQK